MEVSEQQKETEEAVKEEIVKEETSAADELEAKKEALRQEFLAEANKVEVSEDAVTFFDAVSNEVAITIPKNPQKVVNLYGSFTTLWYEAGGKVIGCIG